MNPPLKKICILGLAAGIGTMILDQVNGFADMTQDEKEMATWNAIQLRDAGLSAIAKANVKVDNSRLKQCTKKIDQVCKNKTKFDVAGMLSFLFLGLNDLNHYCKGTEFLKPVEDAALNFVTLFDPNLEDTDIHVDALNRYQKWVE